jgi:hypothetical protein
MLDDFYGYSNFDAGYSYTDTYIYDPGYYDFGSTQESGYESYSYSPEPFSAFEPSPIYESYADPGFTLTQYEPPATGDSYTLPTSQPEPYRDFASVPFYSAAPTTDAYAQSYFSAMTMPYANSWQNHSYSIVSNATYPTFGDAITALHANPAPGVSYPGGVQTGQVSYVAPFGDVTHYVNPATGTVFNVTQSNHLLDPGYVMREVVQDPNNQFRIHTVGEGSGFPYGASGLGAPWVWDGR